MYKILDAKILAGNIYQMVVEAPRVAKRCLPGQFVIVKLDETAERVPLTICDYDREKGTITIVFQPVGASTSRYKFLEAGDAFEDFVGPLGQPSDLCTDPLDEVKKKKILFVAGGVGTATGLSSGKMAPRTRDRGGCDYRRQDEGSGDSGGRDEEGGRQCICDHG